MNNSSTEDSLRHVVDEVRALRAEVSGETHGFERMGEYLRKVRDEYLNRTGRFAGLGREPSESVRQAIASAPDDDSGTLVDEVRPLRRR
jgi:hypothetical protein